MRFIEKILVVLAVIGLVMRFNFDPSGSVIFAGSMALLIIIYFAFFPLLLKSKEYTANDKPVSILSGVFMSFAMSCIVLRVFYFNTSYWIFVPAIISTGLMLFIVLRKKKRTTDAGFFSYYGKMVSRLVLVFGISAISFSVPVSYLVRVQFRNDPKLAELYVTYLADTENTEAWRAIQQYQIQKEDEIMNSLNGSK